MLSKIVAAKYKNALALGTAVGAIYCFLFYWQIQDDHRSIYLSIVALGVFIDICMLEPTILTVKVKEKYSWGLLTALTSTIAMAIGIISNDSNEWIKFALLLLPATLFALTASSKTATMIWGATTGVSYLLGLSFNVVGQDIIYYSLAYGLGMVLQINIGSLVLKGFHVAFRQKQHNEPLNDDGQKKLWQYSIKNIRLAINLFVISVIALFIAGKFSIGNPFWILIFVYFILRYDIDVSYQRICHRVYGTLLGAAIVFPVLYFNYYSNLLLFSIWPLSMLLLMSVAYFRYGIYTVVLTTIISIGMACLRNAGVAILELRIEDTVIAVVLVGCWLLFIVPLVERILPDRQKMKTSNRR